MMSALCVGNVSKPVLPSAPGEGEYDVIDSTHVSQVNVVFHLLRVGVYGLAPMN